MPVIYTSCFLHGSNARLCANNLLTWKDVMNMELHSYSRQSCTDSAWKWSFLWTNSSTGVRRIRWHYPYVLLWLFRADLSQHRSELRPLRTTSCIMQQLTYSKAGLPTRELEGINEPRGSGGGAYVRSFTGRKRKDLKVVSHEHYHTSPCTLSSGISSFIPTSLCVCVSTATDLLSGLMLWT